MKPQTFFAGLALAAILILAAITLGDRHPGEVSSGELLMPPLNERLNDITRIRIQGDSDQTVTLVREQERWMVGERGYPADVADIRELLINLSEASTLEEKTSNPTLYERLGVQDHGTGETANKQILIWAGDEQLVGILLGKNAGQPRGTYVRLVGGDTSALADRVLVASADVTQWLETDLINVPPEDIVSVQAMPVDGEPYSLSRSAEAGDLTLDGLDASESEKGASVARVGRVLQNLRLEDVLPADAETPADGWSKLLFTLDDGSTITLQTAEAGDDKLLRMDIQPADDADSDLVAAAGRTAGRSFVIQGYKFNDASQARDDLIQADDTAG